ncbi:LysR family transcriptional regulator [Shimia sp. CNT1-13L.2]|uniref:LysR family transcriptional regulator n=1 Tax=Shimia sp. CNT1-13L.2 TaxID=2959663 RepID=UPI0020CC06C0|nr:LysR family transcriptional regulator [Shimia sp. CNT1-13L.2]MCP9483436.1 LysR family transcriptional regulator [Shimia sp. CNT1-13L.2]
MSINYDFGDLEAFLAVKETGSFHAAATRLNLSQSAITRRVRKLENALDSQLFVRTTRAVKPTLAAKRLQARAEALLQDARETSEAMRDESVAFAHQRNALVTVAAIPTVISRVVLPALDTLREQGLLLRVRFLDMSANDVAEAVADGEADFGISSIPALEPTTEFEPLFEERIVLALSRSHSLAGRSTLDWTDLQNVPLILPARGTGNRLLIDEAIAQAHQTKTWRYEVGRTSTALEMVIGGFGAALVPESAALNDHIACVPLNDPRLLRSIGILRGIGRLETEPVAALIKAIKQAKQEARL